MKKFVFLIFILLGFFITSANAVENYVLDPTHSYVEWHISHFGFSHPSGKWLAEGNLVLDEQNMQNSKVNVTIMVAKGITGIPKLDEHMKSIEFFDATQFPKVEFTSTKVTSITHNQFKVFGLLKVHGMEKPVTLIVTRNKIDINPMMQLKVAGFSAHATIKRSDFGIKAYLPNLGDEIKLDIEVEAQLKK